MPPYPKWRNEFDIWIMILLSAVAILLACLTGCSHFNKETNTFYGFGTYKDKDVEMSCDSPVKDMGNVGWR